MGFLISTGFAVLGVVLCSGIAQAEDLRAPDLVRALAPPLSRSLSSGPSAAGSEQAADETFVNSVRDRGRHSLSENEVEKLDSIISKRRDVNIEMNFNYNSMVLAGKSLEAARELGKALSSPELKDQTFLIMGHTDAKGSDLFNQKLSERRAAWVKDFLVEHYKVPANRLVPVGYGETHLKNHEDPNSAENRRVQVVNIMAYKAANSKQ
jgi:outer membrane protein OmpA-like peptidoglycan-associated protein